MTLTGARVALGATEAERRDLSIQGGRVSFETATPLLPKVDLTGFLVLPGLINAHDHLEFSLFPRLGSGPYPNASEWARDIYRPDEGPIREHLQVPKPVRFLWGAIKNLISGVTTVCHHNAYKDAVFENGFPVRVMKNFGWAHSLEFSGDVVESHRATPDGAPFLIHACEGTDRSAQEEVFRLDEAGVLDKSTILVHGVGLDADGIQLMERRGAALIWCPSSNCFTLGQTLSTAVLRSRIPIALGTDSPLTAAGDLVDELACARQRIDLCRLYDMVTRIPARILGLSDGEGSIREGGLGDLVVVRDRGQSPAEAILDLRPELVLVGGRVNLVSVEFAERIGLQTEVHRIEIEGRGRWFIGCDTRRLAAVAKAAVGNDLRLGGRAVSA